MRIKFSSLSPCKTEAFNNMEKTMDFFYNSTQWTAFKLLLSKLRGVQLLFTYMIQFHAMRVVKMLSDGHQQIHTGIPEELQNERKQRGKNINKRKFKRQFFVKGRSKGASLVCEERSK